MASKVVILAAMMATLVVMTHATEVEIEDGMDGASDRRMSTSQCHRQLLSQWPKHCEQYMMRGMRRYRDEDNQGTPYFEQCCDDLRMMQPQCQCEAMKMMMEVMRMKLEERMMAKAMMIPMMCGTMQHMCSMSHRQ